MIIYVCGLLKKGELRRTLVRDQSESAVYDQAPPPPPPELNSVSKTAVPVVPVRQTQEASQFP